MSCSPAIGAAGAEPQGPARSRANAHRRRSALSYAVAGTIAAGVLTTGAEEPLPTILWAAVFLFLACFYDVKSFRIPNWLNGTALLTALLLQGFLGGGQAMLAGAVGMMCGFGILLLPYAAGFLGAGDVKAVMAVGAAFGLAGLLPILTWSAFIGGAIGITFLLVSGALFQTVSRLANGLAITFFTRRWTYLTPEPGSAATRVLPFACVLGLAVVAHFAWGTPWA